MASGKKDATLPMTSIRTRTDSDEGLKLSRQASDESVESGAAVPLVTIGAGSGGINEMRGMVDDATVQFGLVRFQTLGSGNMRRNKVLFVHMNGEKTPPVSRGQANGYLPHAKSILRGGDDSGQSFHASVEVTEKSDVTAENILSRVSKYFITDDIAEYSVQWLTDQYNQFILASSYTPTSLSELETDHHRTVRCPGHRSSFRAESGRKALKAVADDFGPWNWVFMKADPVELPLVEGGSGSVDEMCHCMIEHPKEVLFGVLRLGFGIGRLRRTKYVFVQAIGEEAPAFTKGKVGAMRPKMEEALACFALVSVSLEFSRAEDFTLEEVINRVRQASIIDDDNVGGDNPRKCVFSVEHFREALREEHAATGADDTGDPAKSRGGFGDMAAEDVVKLVRAPDGPINWALFAPSETYRKSRPSLIRRPSGSCESSPGMPMKVPRPSLEFSPPGGFTGAGLRSRASTSDSIESAPKEPGFVLPTKSSSQEPLSSRLPPESPPPKPPRLPSESPPPKPPCPTLLEFRPDERSKDASATSPELPLPNKPVSASSAFAILMESSPQKSCLDTSQPILATPLRSVRLHSSGVGSGVKPRLCGGMLKQRRGDENHWQLRHFEISSGKLKWWETLKLKENGYSPKNELDLQGLRVQKKSATKFELQTLSLMQNGRVYILDADIQGYAKDTQTHNLSSWVQALEQEAILARRAAQVTLGGTSPASSPRVEPVLTYRRVRAPAVSPSHSVGSSSMSDSSPMRPTSRLSLSSTLGHSHGAGKDSQGSSTLGYSPQGRGASMGISISASPMSASPVSSPGCPPGDRFGGVTCGTSPPATVLIR